jgi:hypothetical protein
MPDTPENQACYPQPNTQAPGVGFPLARLVRVICLSTGALMDAAMGPHAGKETGELGLLRRAGLGFSDKSLSGRTAIFSANRRSSTDETTETQPLTGLQGPSGFGRLERREDPGAASVAL